jgi:2-iminobutanoate/2-iminopropanoate deaminase
MKKQITCKNAPAAIGPYSQATLTNGILFISGQLPLDVNTGEIPVGIAAQTRQILENIKAIITDAGGNMDNIVRCGVFLQDMNDFAEMNEVYKEYFNDPAPARTTIEVSRLPKDVPVEIDAFAII